MSVSEKVKRPSNSAIQRQADDSPARSMMPPEMALTASPVQMKGDGEPKIGRKDAKTMEHGEASTGPVSVKGEGDAHAFDATDVNQGALGDCYLLAALMTLANTNPGLLDDAISKKDDGTYDVTLYKRKGFLGSGNLEQQTVNVTSSFVVHEGTSIPAYAKGGDFDMEETFEKEIWVQLIEKAYAKMNGGYKKINGGFEEVALEALTGEAYSSSSINGFLGIGKTSDADMKTNIKAAVDDKEPVTASTKSQKAIDKADKKAGVTFADDNDIVGRHAYSVMEADESKIKVRNPWGSGAKNPEPVMDWKQFRSYYGRFTTKKA